MGLRMKKAKGFGPLKGMKMASIEVRFLVRGVEEVVIALEKFEAVREFDPDRVF